MKVKVQQSETQSGPGRPPKYVVYKKKVVEGLSYKPGTRMNLDGTTTITDGRFYSSHNDRRGRRVYFGKDLDVAVKEFRKWNRKQGVQS